jgi:hypothetical protein
MKEQVVRHAHISTKKGDCVQGSRCQWIAFDSGRMSSSVDAKGEGKSNHRQRPQFQDKDYHRD